MNVTPPRAFEKKMEHQGPMKLVPKIKPGTITAPKPRPGKRTSPFEIRDMPPTEFRLYYNRGDIPASIQHGSYNNRLLWKTELHNLDYHHYLPLFFEGLRELQYPYNIVAEQGTRDLLMAGGQRIVPVIPQLILPIKQALDTRNEFIICRVLRCLQLLVSSDDLVGPALVPYFRQILPVFNLFYTRNINIGDSIYYGQKENNNIGDLIMETLELFERKGGSDALINIRYMVPQYQSCIL
ncbi:Parkin-co-regulated protein, putative [Giardia lamblia P15]|uniref:Parkin-co-regulated protein, putative n=1 Tax=Giardia intestinalis (strain P15) TaxID=658858 RepID=E1F2W8_GIAIA|nr:Parkin-co-regulated protein, putative [Giardia lamblia P15]